MRGKEIFITKGMAWLGTNTTNLWNFGKHEVE
jgi:hypothetical protein